MESDVRQFRVLGRVQGVGFRHFVRETARRLELTGWVRNADDGSVIVVAAGKCEKLQQLETALRTGPGGAMVDHLETGTIHAADPRSGSQAEGAPNAWTHPFQVVR